jgi:hypothetical protein
MVLTFFLRKLHIRLQENSQTKAVDDQRSCDHRHQCDSVRQDVRSGTELQLRQLRLLRQLHRVPPDIVQLRKRRTSDDAGQRLLRRLHT